MPIGAIGNKKDLRFLGFLKELDNSMNSVINYSETTGNVRSGGATAKWADPVKFTDENVYQEGKFWLGRSHVEATPIGYGDDRHIMLTSSTRSGKGTSIIINNLCLWPGSVIVLDPKGENACVTAARRGEGSEFSEGMGQKVYVLDPFNAARTVDDKYRACFNPLDAIDPDSPSCIDDVKKIVESLIVIPSDAKEPFWQNSARDMLRGLILHVLSDPGFEGRRNLVTVRKLILNGDKESVELLRSAGEKDLPTAQEMLWTGLARNPSFNGVISGIGENYQSMVVDSFKTFKGIHLTLSNETEFLDSPKMAETLSRSDFKLSDLKTDPKGISVYLCLPQGSMESHFRWMRTILTLTVNEMEATPGKPACGHQVLMIADEFASLQYMPVIEKAVGYIAGLGLKFFFVLQSLEQLGAIYEKTWQTFMANCGLKLFFSIEDNFSVEHISKMFGDTEVRSQVSSSSHTQNISDTSTEGKQHSRTTGRGESHSKAVSDMAGSSTQESEGTSTSKSHTDSKNWGEQKGKSGSFGSNLGRVYETGFIGAAEFSRDFMPFRTDRQGSRGEQWNSGWSRSASRGGGISDTEGSSYQKTVGKSFQQSRTETVTNTASTQESETEGTQTSQAHTEGTSDQKGFQETLNYRPLISPDEIRRFLARIDDRGSNLYPGLCLVVIAGQDPFVLRKCNYFEDMFFDCYYDAHPDHPDYAPESKEAELQIPRIKYPHQDAMGDFPRIDFSDSVIRKYAHHGEPVKKGQLIAKVGPYRYRPDSLTMLCENMLSHRDVKINHYDESCERFHNVYASASGTLKLDPDRENIGSITTTRRWRYDRLQTDVPDHKALSYSHFLEVVQKYRGLKSGSNVLVLKSSETISFEIERLCGKSARITNFESTCKNSDYLNAGDIIGFIVLENQFLLADLPSAWKIPVKAPQSGFYYSDQNIVVNLTRNNGDPDKYYGCLILDKPSDAALDLLQVIETFLESDSFSREMEKSIQKVLERTYLFEAFSEHYNKNLTYKITDLSRVREGDTLFRLNGKKREYEIVAPCDGQVFVHWSPSSRKFFSHSHPLFKALAEKRLPFCFAIIADQPRSIHRGSADEALSDFLKANQFSTVVQRVFVQSGKHAVILFASMVVIFVTVESGYWFQENVLA